MSRRTVSRFAAACLLTAALAVPSPAQVPNPWMSAAAVAPLPRAKCDHVAIEIEFGIEVGSGPVLFGRPGVSFEFRQTPAPPVREERGFDIEVVGPGCLTILRDFEGLCESPAGRSAVPPPPCCAFDCPQRIAVPPLGPSAPNVALGPVPPSPPTAHRQPFNFSVGVFGNDTPTPPAVTPASLGVVAGAATGNPRTAAAVRQCCEQGCEKAGKLAGTWVRETDGMVIAATFAGDELKICVTQTDGTTTAVTTLTADYAVTKEGLVHGVISGADVDVKRAAPKPAKDDEGEPGPSPTEVTEIRAVAQQMVDSPFSFRVKSTSAGVMVSGLRVGCPREFEPKEVAPILCGMYKAAKDGTVPCPKPLKTATGGMTLPSPMYLQHYPQYFSPDAVPASTPAVQPMSTPTAPCPAQSCRPATAPGCGAPQVVAPPMPQPSTPGWTPAQAPSPSAAAPPDMMKQMMMDVFGEMLGNRPGCGSLPPLAAPCPAQSPPCMDRLFVQVKETPTGQLMVQPAGAAVLPEPTRWAPPQPSPQVQLQPGSRPLTGTWVREVGPAVYVIKIAPDHFTITATAAAEVGDGKTMTEGMVLTADYHLTRDGTTLVGLITGVDMVMEGDLPDEGGMGDMDGELARMQKSLTDKPLALTVRVYGDTLMIGNVRLPSVEGMNEVSSPFATLGGRYKSLGDKPLPKPKVMKAPASTRCVPPAAVPPGVIPADGLPGPYGPFLVPPGIPFLPPVFVPPGVPCAPGLPCPPGFPCPQRCPGPPVTLAPPAVYPQPYSAPSPAQPADLIPPTSVSPAPAPPPEPAKIEPMAKPIPPATEDEPKPKKSKRDKKKEKKVVATEVAVAWQKRVEKLPDPANDGAMTPSLTGRLFLFGSNLRPASPDGKLTVAVYDETPRAAGQKPNKPECWEFDTESLKKLWTEDDRFGMSGGLVLPWPTYTPDVTRVRIAVRFEPDQGRPIYAEETKLDLEPVSKKSKKEKNRYSSDPNIRMKELLYQSEDLRQIGNEWRRFWFSDQPSSLHPERIHGGII